MRQVQPVRAPEDQLNRRKSEFERRKWTRLPLAIPVFVHSTDENNRELLEFASALNISAGGSLIVLRRPIPLSARVLLEIPNSPTAPAAALSANPTSIAAKVTRVNHAKDYHLVAFEFLVPLLAQGGKALSRRRKAASSV